jgi:hypothetical protein
MSPKRTAILLIALFSIAITFSACGSRKSCSNKGKTKVEMGWM